MNYLILANCGPHYYNFYRELAKELMARGDKVFWALDSHCSEYYNQRTPTDGESLGHYSILTDYIHQNPKTSEEAERLYHIIRKKYRLWNYYPDFQRNEYYPAFTPKEGNTFGEFISQKIFFFLYDIIIEKQITGIFYESASNLLALTAESIAKELSGVTYYGIEFTRLPGRIAINSDQSHPDSKLRECLEQPLALSPEIRQAADSYWASFLNYSPDYMKDNVLNKTFLQRYLKLNKLKTIPFLLKTGLTYDPYDFQGGFQLLACWQTIKRFFLRSCRIHLVSRLYAPDVQKYQESFFLYPLHYHPEASTSVLARYYSDEYEVIRNIAFSLPENVFLYVKEHPSAIALNSLSFYKRVAALPNVRILPHYLNTKSLISQSCGVVTLTSTVGYEALLLGKKVLLFGDVFYQIHRNVRKHQNYQDLPDELDWLAQPVGEDDLAEYNHKFIYAYYAASLPIILNYNNADPVFQRETARRLLDAILLV